MQLNQMATVEKVIQQNVRVVLGRTRVDHDAAKIESRGKVRIESRGKVKNVVDRGDAVDLVKSAQNELKIDTQDAVKRDDRDVAKRNGIAAAKNAVQNDVTIVRQSIQFTIVIRITHRNIEIVHCHQCLHVVRAHHQTLRHQIQRNLMSFVAMRSATAVPIRKNHYEITCHTEHQLCRQLHIINRI